jgi:hypothetical protein
MIKLLFISSKALRRSEMLGGEGFRVELHSGHILSSNVSPLVNKLIEANLDA